MINKTQFSNILYFPISAVNEIESRLISKITHGFFFALVENPPLYELSRIVEISALGFLSSDRKAFGKGLMVGAISFVAEIITMGVVDYMFNPDAFNTATSASPTDNTATNAPSEEPPSLPRELIIPVQFIETRLEAHIQPIIEELSNLVFRKTIEWCVQKAFNQTKKELEICNVKINSKGIYFLGYHITATKIAIFATSIIFVMRHDKPLIDKLIILPHILACQWIGSSDGEISAFAAHIFHNTLAVGREHGNQQNISP